MWPPPPPSSFPHQPAPEWDAGPVWAKLPEPRPSRFARLSRRGRRIVAGSVALVAAALVVMAVGANHDSHVSNAPAGSNGESVKDAGAILGDSALAFSKVQSFHLTGQLSGADETDVYDLHVSQAGTTGTITAAGKVLQVVVVGEDAYLRGREFVAGFAGPEAARLLGDKWVHARTDDPKLGRYLLLFNLAGLQQVISQTVVAGELDKGSPSQVDGRLVIALTDPADELDVALDGKPYPVRLRYHDSSGDGRLDFGEFDTPQPAPQAPRRFEIFGEAQQLSL